MYRRILIGAAALAAQAMALPAFAQQQAFDSIDPTEMLASLDAESIAPSLSATTSNSLAQVDDAGNQFITAHVNNGLTFEIYFNSCAEALSQDCKAMYLMAVWEPASPENQANVAALVNNFQVERPIISTGFLPDGKPYLLRFVIADYGIAQGNVVSEISNFIQNATDYHNMLTAEDPSAAEE